MNDENKETKIMFLEVSGNESKTLKIIAFAAYDVHSEDIINWLPQAILCLRGQVY